VKLLESRRVIGTDRAQVHDASVSQG
jgi:hypothetical protein